MNETNMNLNYFKDSEGNYIIRRVCNKTDDVSYIVYSGTFSSNFLFNKEDCEKKVEESFERIATSIEENVLKNYKIKKEDIIFEKIIGNFVDEKEYNPMFSKMTEEEIIKFCGNSTKLKINIAFEFNILVKKDLRIKAFKDFLSNKWFTK